MYRDPETGGKKTQDKPMPLFDESGLSGKSIGTAQCETGAVQRRSEDSIGAVPDKAHARKTDRQTSHQAAASVNLENLGRTKDRILSILLSQGVMTDEELVDYFSRFVDFKVSPSGIRSRRAWLVDHGFIQVAGVGTTRSGRNCSTWRLASRPVGETK